MMIGLGILAAAGIFVLDCLLPLGIADGMLYMIPVLIGLWVPDKRYVYVSALSAALLIVLGCYLSPGAASASVIVNRVLSVAVVWVSAGVCLLQKRTQEKLDRGVAFTRLLQDVAVAVN